MPQMIVLRPPRIIPGDVITHPDPDNANSQRAITVDKIHLVVIPYRGLNVTAFWIAGTDTNELMKNRDVKIVTPVSTPWYVMRNQDAVRSAVMFTTPDDPDN